MPFGITFPTFSESKREFRNLGLTPEEMEDVLSEQYGLTMGLQKNFPDRVNRGEDLMASFKALYVFEHLNRDCSYAQIADALEVSPDTAYNYMAGARDAIKKAYGLEIITQKEQVRLVTSNDLREKTARFVEYIESEVAPKLKKVEQFAASIKQSNQAVLMPPKAAAFLQAASTPDGDYVQV